MCTPIDAILRGGALEPDAGQALDPRRLDSERRQRADQRLLEIAARTSSRPCRAGSGRGSGSRRAGPGPWKVDLPPRSVSTTSTSASAGTWSSPASVRRPSVTTGGCSRNTTVSGIAPCETAAASDRWRSQASPYGQAKVEEVRPAAHPLSLTTTCKAASEMKVTLMIADFARVANGKLDVIGGGWSMMNAQGPFGFFVAALFQIPWDQTTRSTRSSSSYSTRTGRVSRSRAARPCARRRVRGRPPAGLRPGTPVDAPLVVPFGPLELEEGRYELRLTIADEALMSS